eukprot:TRINITY_DN2475_c2_g1_i1.p1 TRINITY_DN2475_c2_g1~~TRINITY_DN2475_c2_g1_i1.p1  ORF type:complete len:512 (+),score=132.53 TRINITY_DN2475_c2_g1_i1:66-1538(+)
MVLARPLRIKVPMSAPLCPRDNPPGLISPQAELPPPARCDESARSEPVPETPLLDFGHDIPTPADTTGGSLHHSDDLLENVAQELPCEPCGSILALCMSGLGGTGAEHHSPGRDSADGAAPDVLRSRHEQQLRALREQQQRELGRLFRQHQQEQQQQWAGPQASTPISVDAASSGEPYNAKQQVKVEQHRQYSLGPRTSPTPSSDPASTQGVTTPSPNVTSPPGSQFSGVTSRSASGGSGGNSADEHSPAEATAQAPRAAGQCSPLHLGPTAPNCDAPEDHLVQLVDAALADKSTNPYSGSLAMAVVQCSASSQAPKVYEAVVGQKYARSFHDFIRAHPQFRVFHYHGGVVKELGLTHCCSDGARIALSRKSNMELATADQRTAVWREQRLEEAVSLIESLLRQRPMHMRALLQNFRQADSAGRFKGVLPSNHAFRKLVRDRPARIICTTSTLLKVPEQLNPDEKGIMMARQARAAERRPDSRAAPSGAD